MQSFFKLSIIVCVFGVLTMATDLRKQCESYKEEFVKIRQYLHENPELRYEEKATAKYIANYLRNLGLEVREGIGVTGLMAILDTGKPGKTVGVRADMDALPIKELSGVKHTSKNEGVMHACGHDGHMAAVLMSAKVLTDNKEKLKGKIIFIFQPAEEGGAGAEKMIADGVLDNPKIDVIFGYHNWPLGEGIVSTRVGTIMAGAQHFEIVIEGKGGHAAMPHLTVNPIVIGARIVNALQEIVAQRNPVEPLVINFGAFSGGQYPSVVPDKVRIQGTLRTVSEDTYKIMTEKIRKTVINISESANAKAEMNFSKVRYPATINTKHEVELVLASAREVYGEERVRELAAPVMPAEDFSFFLQKIPGCYLFVGHGTERPSLHSAKFDYNDNILTTAASVLSQTVVNYLNQH